MSPKRIDPHFKQERTRVYPDKRHDTYQEDEKREGTLMCDRCGCAWMDGRWSWDPVPLDAESTICPACRRIEDNYPAGIVRIDGPFVQTHAEEIRNLIRQVESSEKGEHPMERFLEFPEEGPPWNITTTGTHLARRIGESLNAAFEGELRIDYRPETFLRVWWSR